MSTSTQERPSAAPANKKKPNIPGGADFHPYPWWTPKFWHGMTIGVWLRLLARNGFRVSPSRIPTCLSVTFVSLVNTVLWLIQEAFLGRKIDRSRIEHPPVFIIGHWRSGTTYLHELMVLDPAFAFPTTYECFVPSHSLISDWLFKRYTKLLLPEKRPMDNMATGWDHPQEDEFALCNLGAGSPYTGIAFSNLPPQQQEYLDLKELPLEKLAAWKRTMLRFIKQIAYRKPKPIVLKSPPHTARVRTLLELFPNARFVHIVRDPAVVFQSTLRLWRSMYQIGSLQVDDGHDVTDYVLDCMERMYKSLDEDRALLRPSQFYEVRYEHLVRDPVGQLRAMYDQLGLGDFERARPALEAYLDENKDYKTNRYELPEETRRLVRERWGRFFERYGYFEEQ